MQPKLARWRLSLLVALLLSTGASADFELAILYPVPKTVVVPEDADPSVYSSLVEIRDLTIEIPMSGNMMRDVLVDRLNGALSRANKRIVLSGEVKDVHVKQLRRVKGLEVAYRMGEGGMSDKTFNALYALGPVRKVILLSATTSPAQLERIGRLKFYVPMIRLADEPLPEKLVAWLEEKHHRNNYFILSADSEPARIYELTRFEPLHLELETLDNRVPEKILSVIKDLRGVEVVLRVNGRLTLADAKRFANLERFGIRVDLGMPARYTPGLFRLLNRIAPPL